MIQVRDRLSERITSTRLKLEAKRSGPNFVVLLVGLGASLFGAAWIFSHVAPSLLGSGQQVAFSVDSARAVRPGLGEVRVKGVPAGRVSGVELRDGRAVIEVEVEEEYGPIYRDARAELRPNSALEDQFIDIVDRGRPGAGKADGDKPLPPAQTTTPVSVDDVLNVFNANTRSRLRALLADLGTGLDDNGEQLANAFAQAAPLLDAAGRLSRQLAGRKPMTERLVHNTAVLTKELARRDEQIRSLVRGGSATLSTLEDGATDLDATLHALPPTLRSLDTGFAATRAVLGDVNTAVHALRPVADELTPALRAVRAISADAAPAVRALQEPVQRLLPLARSLVPLGRDLSSAVTRLRPQIPVVNRTTRNLAACKKGVQGFFQWDASMTKFGDVRGQAPRGNLVAGLQTLGLPSPEEAAFGGCVPGQPIGGRPPAEQDEH